MNYPSVFITGERLNKLVSAWANGDDQPFQAWQTAMRVGAEVEAAEQELKGLATAIEDVIRQISYALPRKKGVYCDDCSKYRVKGRLVAYQIVDAEFSNKQRVCAPCMPAAVNRLALNHPTVLAASAAWLAKRDELAEATREFTRTLA